MDLNTYLAPVINARQRRRIETYLTLPYRTEARRGSREQGAGSGAGSGREQGGVLHAHSSADIPKDGFDVSATVVEAQQQMTILKPEVFGPVTAAAPLGEPEEAIAMAKENPYGLSAHVDCSGRSEALAPSTRRQAGVSWSMARRRRNLPFLKVDEKPQGMGVIQVLKAWMVIWLQKLS